MGAGPARAGHHVPVWRSYVDLARPFTLVAPALGFLSGALTAVGAAPREPWAASLLVSPLLGSAMAALLNAGNNALNQIYDLEIDRVNKPKRPLPSGRLTVREVWTFTNITYALALAALGVALGLAPRSAIVAIVVSATVGALAESALGATLEGPGILNNDMLNFINTAVAATPALVIA